MTLLILILGFLFGASLQYAQLNKYNVIAGLAMRKNFAVAKAIALSVGIGVILLNLEIVFGLASFHVKPFILGGIIFGGLIFGSGMAILGYCPGTLAVSLGEGSLDALVGIIGGLFGGLVFTLLFPYLQAVLGPDFGALSLHSLIGTNMLFYILLFVFGGIFIGASFWLHKMEKVKDLKWMYSGIALALLNVIVFSNLMTNRPIGASTAFPYLSDLIAGISNNNYFTKIQKPGHWEVIFLGGAFLAGLVISFVKKEFKFTLMHSNWILFKGKTAWKRIMWSFIGGFLLIFGARMAGGCTSGHILSGGMQLAFSSLTFAVFVFAGLLLTGKLFYK